MSLARAVRRATCLRVPPRSFLPSVSLARLNSTLPADPTNIKPFSLPPNTLRADQSPRARATHKVSELSAKDAGSNTVLQGWLHAARKANDKLYFFELRSGGAEIQLVVKGELGAEMMKWPLESVIHIDGTVKERATKNNEPALEVDVRYAKLVNPAEGLPFNPVRGEDAVSDELRAQHRYLDLRGPLGANLKLRSEVAHIVRNYLHANGFTEVETPMLVQSSPEGAREFLVPTRGEDPAFYALPQSPQQAKQLLVAGGAVDRYYQIARCFRDEDGRKDRQPEFTQIDLEMAFVDGAEAEGRTPWGMGGAQVRDVVEGLIKKIWKDVKNVTLDSPFRVLPYDIAMDIYGSDKPDTRFEMYTLPIGYYPTFDDASLDKILLDQRPSTVEWMITPAKWAKDIDIAKFADSQFVSATIDCSLRSTMCASRRTMSCPGRRNRCSPSPWDCSARQVVKVASSPETSSGSRAATRSPKAGGPISGACAWHSWTKSSRKVSWRFLPNTRPVHPPHHPPVRMDHTVPPLHHGRRGQGPPRKGAVQRDPPPVYRAGGGGHPRAGEWTSREHQGPALRPGA